MSGQTEEQTIDFKSEHRRILQTEAFNFSNIITVNVGMEGTKISVHEAAIRNSSKFFDNAMKPEWATSRPDACTVDLTDEDPAIFKIYLHWLYFKTIPTVVTKRPECMNPEVTTLSRCYVMGEMLMDIGFKDAGLNAFRDAMLNQPFYKPFRPGPATVQIIYDGTQEGSPARRFMVDIWMRKADEEWAARVDDMPLAFTLELSKAFMACKRTPAMTMTPWVTSMKDFHEK